VEKAKEHGLSFPLYADLLIMAEALPESITDAINKDLHRTGLHSVFDKKSGQETLKRVLMAFAVFNPQVGYCQSLSMIAAEILLVMALKEEETFIVLTSLVRFYFPDYFTDTMGGLIVDLEIFHVLLADRNPALYVHLKRLSDEVGDPMIVNPFVSSWLSSLLVSLLPQAKLIRLWDAILVEGPELLLRYTLAIFMLMERDLGKLGSALDFYTTVTSLPDLLRDPQCALFPGHSALQFAYSIAKFPFPGMRHLKRELQSPQCKRTISTKGITLQRENSLTVWDDLAKDKDFEEVSHLRVTGLRQTGFIQSFSGSNAHLQNFLLTTGGLRSPSTATEGGGEGADHPGPEAVQELDDEEGGALVTEMTEVTLPLSPSGGGLQGSFTLVTETDFDDYVTDMNAGGAGEGGHLAGPVSPFTRLKALLSLKDPDTDPRVREAADSLDDSAVELVVERFALWKVEDAPADEQNELLISILESSPQINMGRSGKGGHLRKGRSRTDDSHLGGGSKAAVADWVPNLGRLGRMIGITKSEEQQRNSLVPVYSSDPLQASNLSLFLDLSFVLTQFWRS